MGDVIIVLIGIGGLCFALGILYLIIACAIYKGLGGKKTVWKYIKEL